MPINPDLAALSRGRRDRARSLRRAIGGLLLLAIAGVIVFARVSGEGGAKDAETARGMSALADAITGDLASYDVAEAAFGEAARASVFDGYPVFVLELTRKIRRGDFAMTDARLTPVVEAIARGDVVAARAALATAPDVDGYAWMDRLLSGLSAAAARSR